MYILPTLKIRHFRDFCPFVHRCTYPVFLTLTPKMSILCEANVCPLLLIGQDESYFKQYSFSQKCWTGPSGVIKLLPKSDRYYTWMVSAFVLRDFGVGLVVRNEEMKLINERRQGDKWNHYLSKKEGIEVYGTSKKMLKDKHSSIQYFNVGINKEGYWNYSQIAPQVGDVFDILSIKFPYCDFCFPLDQSSGHGRMQEGSLNTNLMNKNFGGKQHKSRDTKIKDLGPYHHILQVGDI